MEIIYLDVNNLKPVAPKLTLCLGYFDGVHIGHQKVISEAIMDSFGPVGVVTFSHAPGFVSKKHKNELILMGNEEKAQFLEKMGVSYLLVLEADEALIKMTADQFIIKVLSKLRPAALYCGPDYRFGYLRIGNPMLLGKYFRTKVIEELKIGDEKISSTRIIRAMQNGELERANTQLGRNYTIVGKVVEGTHIGRKIGFPTANMQVDLPYALPKRGVYITKFILNNKDYYSITNIGEKPTVSNAGVLTIETHIPHYSDDPNMYGKRVELSFIKFLRDEQKFDNEEELKRQLKLDIDQFDKLVLESENSGQKI